MRTLRPLRVELPYPVYVGADILTHLPRLLALHSSERAATLVTDSWLARRHAPPLLAALRDAGWAVETTRVPRGERAKTWPVLERVQAGLAKRRTTRRTPLLALGGGSVGDLTGFAASTWLRGVPCVQIPTTLLAQVDSSIGGKTAIDHPAGKNMVGTFYDPLLVVSDVKLLATLSPRDLRAGLAEVVKLGCILDPPLLGWLARHQEAIDRAEPGVLAKLVSRAVRLKATAVLGDERDLEGQRELLNFGHTLGHALEAASGYRLRHGEAVAWGMRGAVELSLSRGGLERRKDRSDLERALAALSPPSLRALPCDDILDRLQSDKKRRGSRPRFILLTEPGAPYTTEDVTRTELEAMLVRWGATAPRRQRRGGDG